MREIWKDIEGYEGLYQISNLGRVKSLVRDTKNQYGKKDIIMKNRNCKGYLKVGLFKDEKQKYFQIHRLVAQAFIPNPNNYPIVNHKDENKSNNCVYNLEWCTQLYNNNYGTRSERSAITKQKPVIQYSLEGTIIKEWDSQKEAVKELMLSNHITDVCYGRRKTCGGYIWKFREE